MKYISHIMAIFTTGILQALWNILANVSFIVLFDNSSSYIFFKNEGPPL